MASSKKNKKKLDPALLAFVVISYIGIFLIGGLFADNNWQPFTYFRQGYSDFRTLAHETLRTTPALLVANRHKGEGVLKYVADKASPGLTLLQGTLPGGPQLRLIDMDGKEVRRWPIDFFKLWPNPTHLIEEKIPKTQFNYHTQGVELLEDGSVVFNVGDKGTAKLDKCGKVLWTIDRMTHHSVTRTRDGGFWIPAHREIDNIPVRYLFRGVTKASLKSGSHSKFHDYENLILLIDANGQILREFSILESLIEGGFESELFDATFIKKTDPTHINDIEIVTLALADKLPNVAVGDILVSIRQAHMLVIMDQYSGDIKWSYRGGWIRQHDPDITDEGNIIVFNNGSPEFSFSNPQGSSLIMLDPKDNKRTVVYPRLGQPTFTSSIFGEQQLLENGNFLITESRSGRAFEVTAGGEIVWDFVLPYDETYASLIAIARRFPLEYFSVTDWNCP